MGRKGSLGGAPKVTPETDPETGQKATPKQSKMARNVVHIAIFDVAGFPQGTPESEPKRVRKRTPKGSRKRALNGPRNGAQGRFPNRNRNGLKTLDVLHF